MRPSFRASGPFLERPGKLTGPVSYFEIEVSRKVGCVLTSNEVHFVSLAENFTVNFQKFWNSHLEWKTKQLNGPDNLPGISRNGPLKRNWTRDCFLNQTDVKHIFWIVLRNWCHKKPFKTFKEAFSSTSRNHGSISNLSFTSISHQNEPFKSLSSQEPGL